MTAAQKARGSMCRRWAGVAVAFVVGIFGIASPIDSAARPRPPAPVAPVERLAAVDSDFNGDGHPDLAIGSVGPAVENDVEEFEFPEASVIISYGSAAGPTATGAQRWTRRDLPGFDPDAPAAVFGFTIATGDFDGDRFCDLAIGSALETVGEVTNAGAVYVLYGSVSGLSAVRSQRWTQDSPSLADAPDQYEGFGEALAVADFGRGGYADLAIGIDGENVQSSNTSGGGGAVQVLYGSAQGLTATGSQLWSQDSPGVRGIDELDDGFGSALAGGNFAGRTYADLAIGIENEYVGNINYAGAVSVLYGSADGLTAVGNQVWTHDTPGVKSRAKDSDFFGTRLAAGHFAGRIYDDLAIQNGYRFNAGVVNVLYGSAKGLTAKGNQVWTQNTPGVKGRSGLDGFGDTMVAANFGKDHGGHQYEDLAIGVPRDGSDEAGAVNLLYGSAKGLTAADSQYWAQDTPGIKGLRGGGFGESLAVADFKLAVDGHSYAELIVGAPGEPVGNTPCDGAVHVIFGGRSGLRAAGDQRWTQAQLGFSSAQPCLFGNSMAATGSTTENGQNRPR